MVQSRSPRKSLFLLTMLVGAALTTFGIAGSAGAAPEDLLKMVPANSLFCVQINNLDGALLQVNAFLAGLLPMDVSMPVKALLGEMLGSPDARGVNMAGSFAVFSPLPGAAAPDPTRFGILVPVSNYSQFVSGNPNVSAADADGISKIGPAGAAMLSVTQVGGFALVSPVGDDQALVQAKKALSSNTSGLAGQLDAAELKRATSAPLWAYGNIQSAGKMFGPMIQAQLAAAKSVMEQVQEQGQMGMAQAGAAMDMYSTMLDSLLKEGKYASLTLEPSATKIGVGLVVGAVPDTSMADMLKGAGAKERNTLLGYLQDGAAVHFAGSMDAPFWQKINEAYIDMLPTLMSDAFSTADIETFKKMAADATAALGGSLAGSFSVNTQAKPPFQIRYVAALKDPAKFNQVLDQAAKVMENGALAEFYKEMGMDFSIEVQRKAQTYKDVAIDTIKMKIGSTDPDSAEGQMLAAMYGDGMNVQMAATDNLLLYCVGQDPGSMLRELIDQVKGSGPGQIPSEAQAALRLIDGADRADFFMSCNLIRVMQMAAAFAPLPIPQTAVPSQSAVAIAGNIGDGKMRLDVAVPKQQVLDIMGMVMQMQMQQMVQ